MSRRVLVTGAYRGIGAACTLAFAAAGDRVILADIRTPDETAEAARRLCRTQQGLDLCARALRRRRSARPRCTWWSRIRC